MDKTWKKFSTEDKKWVRSEHRDMSFAEGGTVIRGAISFDTGYDITRRGWVRFHGCRQIEIRVSYDGTPRVYETGGYLQSLADRKGICIRSLHIYPQIGRESHDNGHVHLCLGHRIDTRKENSVEKIFNNLVVPYFYFYAYYDEYDEKPWPDLKHDVGSFQNYVYHQNIDVLSYMKDMHDFDILQIMKNEVTKNDTCLCSNKKKSRDCDCRGMEGFWLMRDRLLEAYQKAGILKIPRNAPCFCRKVKAKKCFCGRMANYQQIRVTSDYRKRINALEQRVKRFMENRR